MAELKHLYVIGAERGPYKVGVASDLGRRLTGIQTSSHRPLFIHCHSEPMPNAADVERQIHRKLQVHNLSGEWFRCSLRTVREAFADTGIELQTVKNVMPVKARPTPPFSGTPEAFCLWLGRMHQQGMTEAHCAAALGIDKTQLDLYKQRGTDLAVALACRALFHRLEPWA